ncbi:hypothetical protein [Acinetobacter sp. NIPH 817]|uniref:hypothetical protein n=1 Tax=Acinetobacter sp. NIPH 817 TaxID=520708 RepID=UPI0002CFF654|nr:hypothetical protein [Acinetobacter sp. NIPH 817]ENV03514.1 hypothetical protein F968_01168 [Acinetobacter sp. NIPH 817]
MYNFDLVNSITILDRYFAYRPADTTGYDLEACKFYKIVGKVKYYFFFSTETWRKTDNISIKQNRLPFIECNILDLLNSFNLCPTNESKKILAEQRIKEIQELSEA